VGKRSGVLELAILGLLHDAPMHGYELRKRVNALLGAFRAFSFGSLYPALRDLEQRGLIIGRAGDSGSGRARIVYELTAEGKERFGELIAEAGPAAWEDESFEVRLAFFAQTDSRVRLRILEGRRSRLEERLDTLRDSVSRTGRRLDAYTDRLAQHGLESVEREVRWLSELIDDERGEAAPGTAPENPAAAHAPAATTPATPSAGAAERKE
jgi:DNA-binding PadR family transcriptional regulator